MSIKKLALVFLNGARNVRGEFSAWNVFFYGGRTNQTMAAKYGTRGRSIGSQKLHSSLSKSTSIEKGFFSLKIDFVLLSEAADRSCPMSLQKAWRVHSLNLSFGGIDSSHRDIFSSACVSEGGVGSKFTWTD